MALPKKVTGAARLSKTTKRDPALRPSSRSRSRAQHNSRRGDTRSQPRAVSEEKRIAARRSPRPTRAAAEDTLKVIDTTAKQAGKIRSAVLITSSLSFLLAFQFIIGIGFFVAAGFFQYTLIEILTDNFGIAHASAEILLGGLWFILVILGVGFMLYAWAVFRLSSSSSSTLQKVTFMACLSLHIAPFANAFPWVLLWVWIKALSKD